LVEKAPATDSKITEGDEKSAAYTDSRNKEPISPKNEDPTKYDDPFFRCRSENEVRKARNLRRAKHDS